MHTDIGTHTLGTPDFGDGWFLVARFIQSVCTKVLEHASTVGAHDSSVGAF
jgi:hypothetical protein